jgi:hypothetical protein
MRRILDAVRGIPAQRRAQFRLIEAGRKRLLKATRADGIRLEHVEFVVPFVETDFSLSAWLFYRTQEDVKTYASDGTSEGLKVRLGAELSAVGYPPEWLPLVSFRFASKQEVDGRFKGSYYYCVR